MTDSVQKLLKISRSIFLVGFMASGKSTVGPVLADTLQLPFVDLDQEIEKFVGCSIGELIHKNGEPYFRQLEAEYLRRYANDKIAVVALGGGAFTFAENRAVISEKGISVWLDAPFSLCWERIQADSAVRPLAANENAARDRYETRRALYQQAQFQVAIYPTDTSEDISRKIVQRLNLPAD